MALKFYWPECRGEGTGGVPDLDLALFAVDEEGAEFEVHADGAQEEGVELVVDETREQGGFAHGGVADDDVFQGVVDARDHRRYYNGEEEVKATKGEIIIVLLALIDMN